MNEAPETRLSLLLRLRDGRDQQAWGEFAAIYEPLIYRLARSRGLQNADAMDLTQDVLTRVHRAIDRFDPSPENGSFRGWLNRIARNLTINFLTRQKGPRGSGDTGMHALLESQPVSRDEAESIFQLEYQRELLRIAAERVGPQFTESTWQAFWLTAVEGQSIEHVAQLLNKSPGAVRVARCRVLARLKREVANLEAEA